MRVERLIHRKVRLTHRLVRSDHRRYDKGQPVREKRWLRSRLYRIDLLLERAGAFPGHTWYPGAVVEPGLNANYRRGRSLMRQMRVHFTVGTASGPLIRNKGLAPFLLDRDGTIREYAPADATCADACEWNPLGFGVEVEALARGQFTPQQIASLAALWGWIRGTYGIPDEWHLGPDYDGTPRAPVGSDARGVYNHDALDERKCDRHFDGATPEERDAIRAIGAPTLAPPADEDDMATFATFRYGNDARTVQIDDAGNLRQHYWTGKAWATDVIAGPNGHTAVKDKAVQALGVSAVVGAFGQADRIDVFAQAANGKQIHAYWGGKSWASDTVA